MATKKTDIVVDLSRITKRQMIEWRKGRREIANDENHDPAALEEFDFDTLYKRVITAWPFGEINFETFMDLPYSDSVAVDKAVTGAITELSEKK
jgi:hypothetical protein